MTSIEAMRACERLAWERELLARARRLAMRARIRALTDRLAVWLAASVLCVGAVAAVAGWATDVLSRL